MTEEVQRAVELMFPQPAVVELRAITDQHIHSGYFNDPDLLVKAAETLDAIPEVQGIYVTLNEVDPALLSRRANRVKMRLGRKDATTSDADIIRRHWLPIDLDPVRPSGVSSTNGEHDVALERARNISTWLAEQGFPDPVIADSGNGAHLPYRIDLPNDEEAMGLVKSCLAVLDALFSDNTLTVDTANYNAARIWKFYGTTSRKGIIPLIALTGFRGCFPSPVYLKRSRLNCSSVSPHCSLHQNLFPSPDRGAGHLTSLSGSSSWYRHPVREALGREACSMSSMMSVLGISPRRGFCHPIPKRGNLRRLPPCLMWRRGTTVA